MVARGSQAATGAGSNPGGLDFFLFHRKKAFPMGRGGLKFFRRIGLIRDIKLCVSPAGIEPVTFRLRGGSHVAMIYHDNGELESMSRKAYRTVIAQSYSLAPSSNSSTFKSN